MILKKLISKNKKIIKKNVRNFSTVQNEERKYINRMMKQQMHAYQL